MRSGPHETLLISRASGADGVKGNSFSQMPSVSPDGRYVAFVSDANNLDPDDTNEATDVFVRDLQTHETTIVSRASGVDGELGNSVSHSPSISADGRYVAFLSIASNLHPDDTDTIQDVFVRDLQTHETVLVSRASGADGAKGNDVSFLSIASASRSVSAAGHSVAFTSIATNLHPDDTDDIVDVFVRNLQTHETALISRASGAEGIKSDAWSTDPSFSEDGRYVAFESQATTLHPDDVDSVNDVFLRDLQTHETILISRASGADGDKGDNHSVIPTVSADGRYVAFYSAATNFHADDDKAVRDVFVRDLETHETIFVSRASGVDGVVGNDDSFNASVSDDGRYVAFQSLATTLHPDDLDFMDDVLVRDLQTHETVLVSRASGADGAKGNDISFNPSFSADGRYVAFSSFATNLHPDDPDGFLDIFVRDMFGSFSATPGLLDFGAVLVGTTAGPLSVTLSNLGTEDVEIHEVSSPEAPFAAAGGSCGIPPFTLPAGQSCTLDYVFSPTDLGTVETMVTITGDGGPRSVTLRGTGSPPLGITPDPLDFGSVVVGETGGPSSLTLTNLGTEDILVDEVSTPGAPFAEAGGSCGAPPFSLVPGATCTLDYTFSPIAQGPAEIEVTVTSDASPEPQTVALLGSGVSPLSIAPDPLDFGSVPVGDTAGPLDVTLTNIGTGVVTVQDVSPPAAPFFDGGTNCGPAPFTLAAGESCVQAYGFTPSQQGPAESTVTVASDAPGSPDTITLQGTGVDGEGGFTPVALEVDPDAFLSDGNGVLEPGELAYVAPAWRNDGPVAAPLAGTVASFTGPDGGVYYLALDDADYGIVAPTEVASCRDTGLCYFLGTNDPALRPATHWEASFVETLDDLSGTTHTWRLHIGDSFADVPRTSLFYPWIETLLHNEVTGGCTATAYCPGGPITRGQMSVFLLKAFEGGDYVPPACVEGAEVFADVPFDDIFCPWIEELAGRGVTAGCGGGNYCPNNSVSRDQMAVFLLKTLVGPGYVPPSCGGVFGDVPCPSLFADWIEELVGRGITAGCGGGNYCPGNPVSRDQMAAFLARSFDLTLYEP